MNPDKAKAVVGGFLSNAQRIMLERMEQALREIAGMPWWKRLFCASDRACRALGIGWYWDVEWNPKKAKYKD